MTSSVSAKIPLAVVYEGGGARGSGHAGAYIACKELGIVDKLTVAAGSSIGSLFAIMSCMRLPIQLVHDQALTLDFFRFIKPDENVTSNDANFTSSIGVKDAINFLRNYGVYQPGYLAEYVRRFIAFAYKQVANGKRPSHQCLHSKYYNSEPEKVTIDDVCPRPPLRGTASAEPHPTQHCEYCSICARHDFPWAIPQLQQTCCDGDPTLKDLADLYGCHIVMPTTVLGEAYYLSDISHPQMPAFFASSLSMAMPLLFVPIAWRGYYWLDGGVTDNLPIGHVRNNFLPAEYQHRMICFGFTTNPNPIYTNYISTAATVEMQKQGFNVTIVDKNYRQQSEQWSNIGYRQFTPATTLLPSNSTLVNSNSSSDEDERCIKKMQRNLKNIHKAKEATCMHIVINSMFGMSKYRGADWMQQNFGVKIGGLVLLDTPGIDSTTLITSRGQKQDCINKAYEKTKTELQTQENLNRWK